MDIDSFLYIPHLTYYTMSETDFQQQVMDSLNSLNNNVNEIKEEVDSIKNKFEDFFLNEEDKRDIDEALKEENEGKLFTKEEVFD